MCISEIETNTKIGVVIAVHGARNSGKHRYLIENLWHGPSQGPESIGKLAECDGRWACSTEWELSTNNLNEIFYNPRVKWYFKPNSWVAHFQAQ